MKLSKLKSIRLEICKLWQIKIWLCYMVWKQEYLTNKQKGKTVMTTIKDKLLNIDKQLLADIEGSYFSIYKIKKESSSFKELSEQYQKVKEASYIVNPNFNDANGSLFLLADGTLLFEADFFANFLTNEPLDFEYKVKDYTQNHPFAKTFDKFRF